VCPSDCAKRLHCATLGVAHTRPGPSQLEIEAWDRDAISADDFIGKTIIDLEDRWFDQRWQALGKAFASPTFLAPRPVEHRPLYIPIRATTQGVLSMWVDIMDAGTAKKFKPLDIARPPPAEYQLRLIVWRTKGVKSLDTVRWCVCACVAMDDCSLCATCQITDQNDLYIKAWVQGESPQETDTHWRCKKGKVGDLLVSLRTPLCKRACA